MEKDTLRGKILVFRKTPGKEDCWKFPTICANSLAKGGPSSIVMRLLIDKSPVYGLSNRAYPLSADPPKMTCLQWTLRILSSKISDQSRL